MFPANIATAFRTRKDVQGWCRAGYRADGSCQRERLTEGSEGKSEGTPFSRNGQKNGVHNELSFRQKGPDFKHDFYKILDFVAA